MRNRLQGLAKRDLDWTTALRIEPHKGPLWWAAVLTAHSGDSWVCAITLALVWIFTRGKNPFWHSLAAILVISIVIQALFVFLIKTLIRRERPTGEWGGIYRQYDPHSFPSGHATRATLLAVMGLILGPPWLGLLLAIWAPLVAVSRIMTGLHYVSDILGGVILGIVMGLIMVAVSPVWPGVFPFLFFP
jgi:undecaprenyl-diphosphatase